MSGGFANVRLGVALVAGTGSAATGTVIFSNGNSVTFGAQTSGGSVIITASHAATGVAAAVQSISAGTTQVTSGQVVMSNGSGVVFGASGQTITAAVPTVSFWQNNPIVHSAASLPERSTTLNCLLNRVSLFNPITATRAQLLIVISGGNSTLSGSYSLSLGIYTISKSTASLASSASVGVTWGTGSVVSDPTQYGGQSGWRYRTISLGAWNIPSGEYLLGVIGSHTIQASTPSWTAAGDSLSNLSLPGTATLLPYFEGGAIYSAATGALPSSIVVADQVQSVSMVPPTVALLGVAA